MVKGTVMFEVSFLDRIVSFFFSFCFFIIIVKYSNVPCTGILLHLFEGLVMSIPITLFFQVIIYFVQ